MIAAAEPRRRMRRGRPAPGRRRGDEGVALILALVFVVLMTALVVEFLYDTEVEASHAANQGGDFGAYIAAKSAVADGMALLAEQLIAQTFNNDPLNPSYGEQYDTLWDPWAMGKPPEPLNDATMRTSISDEYGKINLNALLLAQEGQPPQPNMPLVEALRSFFSIRLSQDSSTTADMLVDAILDWLDYGDDDAENPQGAENDYYLGLERPFPCKNGPMDSIEELLLIKGMTPELYFGDSTVDPPQLPLSEYLTVHGDWLGAVNINTARDEVVYAIAEGYAVASGGQVQIDADGLLLQRDQIAGFHRLQDMDNYIRVQNPNDPNNPGRPRPQAQGGPGAKQRGTDPNPTPNPNPNPNPNPQGRARAFIIHGHVFRIRGDGEQGDVMVRIEAFVWRRPMDLSTLANALPPAARNNFVEPQESFRVLDWKVIR